MKSSKLQFINDRPKETNGKIIGAGSSGAVGALIGSMGGCCNGNWFWHSCGHCTRLDRRVNR